MSDPLSAIIVDDELIARLVLRELLGEHPHIQIVGEARSVMDAVTVVREEQPQVVFLDVQMPGLLGFELLRMVDVTFRTVFVTAHDEFALRAFEVNALDYLLKPVHPDRLAQTVTRLCRPGLFPPTPAPALREDDSLLVETGRSQQFLQISRIKCIRSDGDYSQVTIADGGRLVVHKTMNDWEKRLAGLGFKRIHRTAIINLPYLSRIEPTTTGGHQVFVLGDSQPLPVSRSVIGDLRAQIGGKL
ncbi:MAG: response regulator [Blastocatellia bacterium]|nr:response regulator [Blastocatellia bacterium]